MTSKDNHNFGKLKAARVRHSDKLKMIIFAGLAYPKSNKDRLSDDEIAKLKKITELLKSEAKK